MEKFIIYENNLIEESLLVIKANNSRCCIVLSRNNKVIGTLSEGDIIKSLIKGISLKARVETIMKTNFFYLENEDDKDFIKEKFYSGYTLIPILNKDRELINVINFLDFFKNLI